MSITEINYTYASLGVIRYFQADRCFNTNPLYDFNHGRIRADELVTFDCGLMELKEILSPEIEEHEHQAHEPTVPDLFPYRLTFHKAAKASGNEFQQLIAVIIRPEIKPSYILEENDKFEFCGYDLTDIGTCISAITNCGAGFGEAIDYSRLNSFGLFSGYREAVNAQMDLNEKYAEESHTYCEIVEIWRRLV